MTRLSLDKSVLLSLNVGLLIMLILTATNIHVNNPGIDLTSQKKNWKQLTQYHIILYSISKYYYYFHRVSLYKNIFVPKINKAVNMSMKALAHKRMPNNSFQKDLNASTGRVFILKY